MNAPSSTPRAAPAPRPGILDIIPYKPGRASAEGVQSPVKLSANENVLGCSPLAKAAYASVIEDLATYPDGRGNQLRDAIAERYRIEPERIILGCGTDEIFAMLAQTYLQAGDNIIQGVFGFGAYAIAARANEADVRLAPERNYRIDVDALLAEVDERTRLIFIANPANPTGTILSASEIERLHAGLAPDVMLVLDGAYSEFCSDPAFSDGLELARHAANVVVTHTFSKIHGLAALRVGWAYAPLATAEAVDRLRLPFNTSIPAQVAAIAALGDEEFAARSLAHVEQWRPWLTQQLGGLGLEVVPSSANFVLAGFPTTEGRTAAEAEAFLASRGLLVRGVGGYGLPNHLRFTIGLEEHNRAIIETLGELLGRAG
ncbi:MAG TPA: histidinol-phosphate transaminase [Caulobacteraceae bacterium]|jgi:histidinol-phosphate aminotransferase|nr:histidinol-phosphate transaminase [Caulobacteraceae bacterium]